MMDVTFALAGSESVTRKMFVPTLTMMSGRANETYEGKVAWEGVGLQLYTNDASRIRTKMVMERNGGYLHNIPPEGILPATMAA